LINVFNLKVKLYLTSPDDQHPQNNTSADVVIPSGGASTLTPVTVDVSAAPAHLSDFDDVSSDADADDDLSETDDDDDLWTCVSAVSHHV